MLRAISGTVCNIVCCLDCVLGGVCVCVDSMGVWVDIRRSMLYVLCLVDHCVHVCVCRIIISQDKFLS